MASAYLFLPELFLRPFESRADPAEFGPVRDLSVVLLRFVAIYCVFDAAYIVFSAAIKGAGDTRFVMWVMVVLSSFVMVIPTYLFVVVWRLSIYFSWGIITGYIIIASLIFYWRFKGGKWKSMRVIEQEGFSLIEGREAAEVQVREHTDTI